MKIILDTGSHHISASIASLDSPAIPMINGQASVKKKTGLTARLAVFTHTDGVRFFTENIAEKPAFPPLEIHLTSNEAMLFAAQIVLSVQASSMNIDAELAALEAKVAALRAQRANSTTITAHVEAPAEPPAAEA